MKNTFLTSVLFIFFLATLLNAQGLKSGYWSGELQLNDTTELHFLFSVHNQNQLVLLNGEERVELGKIKQQKDSIERILLRRKLLSPSKLALNYI